MSSHGQEMNVNIVLWWLLSVEKPSWVPQLPPSIYDQYLSRFHLHEAFWGELRPSKGEPSSQGG